MFSQLHSNSTFLSSATAATADDSGSNNLIWGFAIAALSAFFNGSFPAWSKATKEEVDPVVFNGLVGLGAFLSSMVVPLLFNQLDGYVFIPLAFVGGVLLIGATLCSFLAIPRLGLGPAMALWSCSAILVSFLWGSLGPGKIHSDIKNIPLSILSLLLLIVGAVVIVGNDAIASKVFAEARDAPLVEGEVKKSSSFVAEPLAKTNSKLEVDHDVPSKTFEAGAGSKILGLAFAMSVGLFGGSILVPSTFIECQDQGPEGCNDGTMISVVSFGCGALVAAIIVTQSYWTLSGHSGIPCVSLRTLIIGILSGATWNAGNVAQIVVQAPPFQLAYGIAYPINQCGMLFGGLWGIFVFREITGKAVMVFWFGAIFLVCGVILLGLFGPGA
jgi:glucose uptake protein GlcU